MTNLEKFFEENHKKYIDDMIYDLAYQTIGPEEITYNNPLGSITIRIKGFDYSESETMPITTNYD